MSSTSESSIDLDEVENLTKEFHEDTAHSQVKVGRMRIVLWFLIIAILLTLLLIYSFEGIHNTRV